MDLLPSLQLAERYALTVMGLAIMVIAIRLYSSGFYFPSALFIGAGGAFAFLWKFVFLAYGESAVTEMASEIFEGSFAISTALGILFYISHLYSEYSNKLEEAHTFLQSVIDGVGEPIMVIGKDHSVKLMNKAANEFSGQDKEKLCHQISHRLDTPCDEAGLPCPLEEVERTKQPATVVHEHHRPEGRRFIEIIASPLYDAEGFLGIIESCRDITERKRIEEELREGERFLNSIFTSIQDGIGIIDRDMNIIRVNPTAERWYPHAAPFVGKKCYEAYHGRSERCEVCPAWRTLQTGESAYEIVSKHGSEGKEIGWVEIYSFPLIDTATGQMSGVIEYVRDITERKKMEQRLKLLSEAVENAPDGVQIVDLEGYVIYSNNAVEKIYGFSPEEFRGKHVNEMNSDPEFAGKVILPSIKEKGRWTGELMVKHKSGGAFPVWLSTSLVRDSKGKPIAMVGIIRDITERKRAEEAIGNYAKRLEEANRIKDLFTDIMHHDLLNPLSTTAGYVEMLSEKERDLKRKSYFEKIEKNLAKGIELIESATLLSKLESAQSIEFEDMDLSEVIENVIESFSSAAGKAGMTIENSIVIKMPVRANRIIEEVFSNLISNAIKYASDGKRVAIASEDKGDFWKIHVKDFGEGISDTYKTAVFERFQRMEKKGVKGSGLGLTIARKVVELHRGRIWVEDNPDGGAVFIVELPRLK